MGFLGKIAMLVAKELYKQGQKGYARQQQGQPTPSPQEIRDQVKQLGQWAMNELAKAQQSAAKGSAK